MTRDIQDPGSREATDDPPERLSAYGEEEEPVTQVIDAEIAPPKWIVQVTPLDRRMMGTPELLNEARRGALVRSDTLIWRGGMDDWMPLEEVGDLASLRRQLPTLSPRANAAPARRSPSNGTPSVELSRRSVARHEAWVRDASSGVLAAVAIVLSTAALTICALAVCGVFESGPASPAPEAKVSASAD